MYGRYDAPLLTEDGRPIHYTTKNNSNMLSQIIYSKETTSTTDLGRGILESNIKNIIYINYVLTRNEMITKIFIGGTSRHTYRHILRIKQNYLSKRKLEESIWSFLHLHVASQNNENLLLETQLVEIQVFLLSFINSP